MRHLAVCVCSEISRAAFRSVWTTLEPDHRLQLNASRQNSVTVKVNAEGLGFRNLSLAVHSQLLRSASGDHEEVFVAVLRWPFSRTAVGAVGELEEVVVEGRRAFGPVDKALVDGDYGAEGLPDELDVVARARGHLGVLAAGELQELDPLAEELAHVFLAAPERR